jgi:hypothetical protein
MDPFIKTKRPYAPGKFDESSIKDILGDIETLLQ